MSHGEVTSRPVAVAAVRLQLRVVHQRIHTRSLCALGYPISAYCTCFLQRLNVYLPHLAAAASCDTCTRSVDGCVKPERSELLTRLVNPPLTVTFIGTLCCQRLLVTSTTQTAMDAWQALPYAA